MIKFIVAIILLGASLSACPQVDKIKAFLDKRIRDCSHDSEDKCEAIEAYREVHEFIRSIEPEPIMQQMRRIWDDNPGAIL